MPPKKNKPKYHDVPQGARLTDRADWTYRVLRWERVPLSHLPGADTRKMMYVERLHDGTKRHVSQLTYDREVTDVQVPRKRSRPAQGRLNL